MASTSTLFMYSLSLRSSDAVTHSIIGNFTGISARTQEILTAQGGVLTLYDVHKDSGVMTLLHEQNTFSSIQNIACVKPSGSEKDVVVMTSDAGRLCVLEYDPEKRKWIQLHAETYGKSGIRRAVPGVYLAVEPKGRAVMIASLEKFKLVYIFGRTQAEALTISSPLEAHHPQNLVLSLTALDVGFENPMFASLEVDFSEIETKDEIPKPLSEVEKQLVMYELDLGINHVVRKSAETVERSANRVLAIPTHDQAPGGTLVCSEELITYYSSRWPRMRVVIPRRSGATENSSRKRIIVNTCLVQLNSVWFWLLQSDDGDIFRLSMETVSEEGRGVVELSRMVLSYFDTLPVASACCIHKAGYLFVGSSRSDNHLYMFQGLGDKPDQYWTSEEISPEGDYEPQYFQPRSLENLLQLPTPLETFHPVIKARVMNVLKEDKPQIYTASGSGANSSLKITRHALPIEEITRSDLPNSPAGTFTTKMDEDDEFDRYILLSFDSGHTLVLKIDQTVEESVDSGFRTDVQTLAVHQMGESTAVQVHPRGVRMVREDGRWGGKNYFEFWQPPQYRSIVAAAMNTSQLALALSDGEIYYMKMGPDDELGLWQQEDDERLKMDGPVTVMAIGPAPEGREISPFLAIGCGDQTIHIVSLDPGSTLDKQSMQALSATPTAINIMPMPDAVHGGMATWLHVGLSSGVFIRTVMDDQRGSLSDPRSRLLGANAVRLAPVVVNGQLSLLALSRSAWLGNNDQSTGLFQSMPLHCETLTTAASLSSAISRESIVATSGRSLLIFNIPSSQSKLMTETIPLLHTPRDFVRHPFLPLIYVIESEQNVLPPELREKLKGDAMTDGEAEAELPEEQFGYPKAQRHWSSCIQIVDVAAKEVVHTLHTGSDECLTSIGIPFIKSQEEHFLVVGVGKKMVTMPRSCEGGLIRVYRFERPEGKTAQQADGRQLEYIYEHAFDDAPVGITAFNGLFLFGVGTTLLAYDLGSTRILRKSLCLHATPYRIVGIQRDHNRIICADVKESVSFIVYKPEDNKLVKFTEDMIQRWITAVSFTDYHTAVGADKFGNIFMLRIPAALSKEVDADVPGAALTHERTYLGGTQSRLELMMHFFVQDIATSIQKSAMVVGGDPVLFWAGLQGTMGFLIPFASREDVDFFVALEQVMRKYGVVSGRDHLAYRSYYAPVKGCIDGDLCEQFVHLDRNTQLVVAGQLDKTVLEVEKRVTDARIRYVF